MNNTSPIAWTLPLPGTLPVGACRDAGNRHVAQAQQHQNTRDDRDIGRDRAPAAARCEQAQIAADQHDHEQEQHDDRAGVHDDLHHGHKLRVQHDEHHRQYGEVQEQRQGAIDRVLAQNNSESAGNRQDGQGEEEK